MPTEKELLALCLRWLEHPGLIHPFDKAMLVESLKAKLEPEPRPWVGFDNEEAAAIAVATGLNYAALCMIEEKLKEKNT